MIRKLAAMLGIGIAAFATAAPAQLLPPLGLGLVVAITAPAAGSVVAGTVSVEATVSGPIRAVTMRLSWSNGGWENSGRSGASSLLTSRPTPE